MNHDPTTSDPLRAFTETPMDFTHSQLIKALCSQQPEVKTRGFPKAMRSLMPADEHPSEYPIIDFVPDCYAILTEEKEVHLFEVEVTSHLSRDKRHSLGLFADDMQGYGWAVIIHSIDRYGNMSVLPWVPMYLSWAAEQAQGATPEEVEEVRQFLGR